MPLRRPRLMVALSPQDPTYIRLENHFQDGWTHPNKPKPQVHAIFSIRLDTQLSSCFFMEPVEAVCWATRKQGRNYVKKSDCLLCSVIRNSFDVSKCGKRHRFCRFGAGIYTTACSSKADDYFIGVPESPFRAVLVNRVVVGNPLIQQYNAEEITELPYGYHSVAGVPGGDLNYEETVVYNNDAIRPAYLIVYSAHQPSDKFRGNFSAFVARRQARKLTKVKKSH
ncbi:PARP catalytic domain-containing protein [Mycena sanguinolenta]|uniref:PARP catalytic domain-containing protein n=1 Tax=Mycena sanguinolenta TaxID=230812 RepID=A0A8H7D0T3_9AGAR|nr:PARP catalytic domain-containing protein [Mycena sanguinolenta]